MRTGVGRLICLCVSVICLYSCEFQEIGIKTGSSGMADVRFVLEDVDSRVRSVMDVSETAVRNLALLAYRDSVLAADVYYTSFADMRMTLDAGGEYDFYVLANVGDVVPPVHERDLSSLTCSPDMTEDTLPMCWCMSAVAVAADSILPVRLTRLAAKVVLDVECEVRGLEVTSAAIMQAPLCVRPFDPCGSRASVAEVGAGDSASEEDVAILNDGGSVCLYVLENIQGTLLEGNDDPMKKVPENISSALACTYIDVRCDFMSGSDKEGGVSYRTYLGRDNVSDFNIGRNSVLHVTLCLTSSGLGVSGSWKIDPDYVQHAVDVVLDKEELEIVVGCSRTIHAEVLPMDACELGIEWISGDTSVAEVDSLGRVLAVGKGQCVVRAVSKDREDVYAECAVRVVPVAPERVELNFSEHSLALEDKFTVKFRVIYNDGTASSFISYGIAPLPHCSPDGWTVSDASVCQINTYGSLTPLKVGTTTVSMTVSWWNDDVYHTCSASGTINVTGAYLVGLYVEAPAMFYAGSGGPGLYGIFSDGSERMLIADEWIVSDAHVSYDEADGIVISDEEELVQGETVCTFTAVYDGMTAHADMLYGRWVREIGCVRSTSYATQSILYRLYVRYDDFTEEFVPFSCKVSHDGIAWTDYGTGSDSGIQIDWNIGHVRLETLNKYHDYTGTLRYWSYEASGLQ